jgi:hypothetical protein
MIFAVDLLIFNDLDGQMYFSQPSRPDSLSKASARTAVDYSNLSEVPSETEFAQAQKVDVGATYVLKTLSLNDTQPFHFVKFKVLSVK